MNDIQYNVFEGTLSLIYNGNNIIIVSTGIPIIGLLPKSLLSVRLVEISENI